MKKSMAGKAGKVMDFCQGCKPSLLSLVREVQAPAAPSQGVRTQETLSAQAALGPLWVFTGGRPAHWVLL